MKFSARSNYVKHLDIHIEKSLRKVRPIPPSRIRSSNFTYFKNRFLLFISSVISFRYSSNTVCYVWKSCSQRFYEFSPVYAQERTTFPLRSVWSNFRICWLTQSRVLFNIFAMNVFYSTLKYIYVEAHRKSHRRTGETSFLRTETEKILYLLLLQRRIPRIQKVQTPFGWTYRSKTCRVPLPLLR